MTEQLRVMLIINGRFPACRTWEQWLNALPNNMLAEQIGCLGRFLVSHLQPWQQSKRAVAVDNIPSRTKGGMWHKKHRSVWHH